PGLYLWLGVVVGTVLLIWLLSRYFPQANALGDPYFLQGIAILALVSSTLLYVRRVNLREAARNILLWLVVAVVLVLGFAYQAELMGVWQRVRAELVPGQPVQAAHGAMTVNASEGGSFHVYGKINGMPVRFLVDTGASEIVLSPGDAARLGLKPENLVFEHPFESANGVGYGAKAVLAELTVGDIRLTDVPVSVNKAAMRSSLLGMTFLRRLKSFEFQDRRLIMRW
ncbi:MAG: TIGR02281 family clan AA aspartic protease, partial [Rubrivivax sp.]